MGRRNVSDVRWASLLASGLGCVVFITCLIFIPLILTSCKEIWAELDAGMLEFRALTNDLWNDMMSMSTDESRRLRRQFVSSGNTDSAAFSHQHVPPQGLNPAQDRNNPSLTVFVPLNNAPGFPGSGVPQQPAPIPSFPGFDQNNRVVNPPTLIVQEPVVQHQSFSAPNRIPQSAPTFPGQIPSAFGSGGSFGDAGHSQLPPAPSLPNNAQIRVRQPEFKLLQPEPPGSGPPSAGPTPPGIQPPGGNFGPQQFQPVSPGFQPQPNNFRHSPPSFQPPAGTFQPSPPSFQPPANNFQPPLANFQPLPPFQSRPNTFQQPVNQFQQPNTNYEPPPQPPIIRPAEPPAVLPPGCNCGADQANRCPAGPPGPPGIPGLVGPAGPNGPDGIPGVDAADVKPTSSKNRDCFNCPPGPAGPPGAPGRKGGKGMRGAVGRPGGNGANGMPGPSGPRGSYGGQGKKGRPGQRGERGADVTQAIGLPGPKGPPGFIGKRGNVGKPGRNAFDGSIGVIGNTGAPGLIGTRGYTGTVGLEGVVGPPGPDAQYCPCPKRGSGSAPGDSHAQDVNSINQPYETAQPAVNVQDSSFGTYSNEPSYEPPAPVQGYGDSQSQDFSAVNAQFNQQYGGDQSYSNAGQDTGYGGYNHEPAYQPAAPPQQGQAYANFPPQDFSVAAAQASNQQQYAQPAGNAQAYGGYNNQPSYRSDRGQNYGRGPSEWK